LDNITTPTLVSLEDHFKPFRNLIIGNKATFKGPYGTKRVLYADWIASGRLYDPIERKLMDEIGPYVANTHTETTLTGSAMTMAYAKAKNIIKEHVGAHTSDVLISSNSGMTGVVNKFQRILGLKLHEKFQNKIQLTKEEKPVVFVTHMEHHSNQTTWLETICEVKIIPHTQEGLVDLDGFKEQLELYKNIPIKIAAITSCSNVTGIFTPYHEIAKAIHKHGGYCFVDFACSAPYIDIVMRPEDPESHLDAIYFSPHKFLGGPGTTGILIFDPKLYKNRVPDHPGGGTVDWTNPWGEHKYTEEIEAREDGGTPAFLQTIKVALCTKLKDEMGTKEMHEREEELLNIIWPKLQAIPNVHILAGHIRERIGAISFYIEDCHYNLCVKLLNDRYGIQVRGGCSCAGTYGHYLLNVDFESSKNATSKISTGDLSAKPGWVRLSIHPVMTDEEANFIANAIEEVAGNFQTWAKDYTYHSSTNEFEFNNEKNGIDYSFVGDWFESK
jgi:selenocysteine lyase/cysteine desulfurase